MKPLKIIVSAFGPYAEKQTIDFTLLEERNFFLIHGPTGAGKTSVLDAICFALYGETSGGERKTKNIRSDYADLKEPTEVIFEFLLGDKRFLIHRSPEQDRPKKRGEGTTKQLSTAALWRINGGEKTVIADRWSKVTDEVKNIIGFDVDQFRQVVILPQGQFRKLLMADSADRQIILETLFKTGIYRKIEEALKEAAKKIKNKAEALLTKKVFILEQAEVKSINELLDTIKDLKNKTIEFENRLDIKRTDELTAQKNLDNARHIGVKLEEKEKALAACERLLALNTTIETKKIKLARGQKAEKLQNAEKNLIARQDDEKKAIDNHKTAGIHFEITKKEKEAVEKNYDNEKKNSANINELRVTLDQLKQLVGKVIDLEEAKNNLNSGTDKAVKTGNDVNLKKEEISELDGLIENKNKAYEKTRENGAKIESIGILIQNHQKEYDNLLRFLDSEKKEKKAQKNYENSQKNLLKSEKNYLKIKEAFEVIESGWIKGQAAILSSKLIDNKPCPVCGSTSHPEPAVSDAKICDEKTLKEKREEIKKSEELLRIEKEKTSELKEIYLNFKTQRETLTGGKESLSDKNISDIEKALKERKAELELCKKDNSLSIKLKSEIEELIKIEKIKKNQLKDSEALFIKVSQEKERLNAVYKERKKNIPDQFNARSDIEKEISGLKNQIETYEINLKDAEYQNELFTQKLAGFKGEVAAALSHVKETNRIVVETEALFIKNILAVGFTDFSDYKTAIIRTDEILDLDSEIRGYHENLKAANERLKRAKKEAKDLNKPDIVLFEKAVFEIKKDLEEIVNTKSRIETLEKQKTDLYRQYLDVIDKSGSIEKEYAVTGRLSEVANGKNAHGMTFQRYVLATLLEDVLYSAGKQLKLMSRGRFDLLRSKERIDMRSAGGLDLLVSDSYTGTTRPVNSLSGGESFLASLSLALGLADVVQSYAGGIKLDTIFVDEGFGSLDPETLDLAFKAFTDLQSTGRLVGIISHVPELKERITTRLEVVPGKRGSKARFVL